MNEEEFDRFVKEINAKGLIVVRQDNHLMKNNVKEVIDKLWKSRTQMNNNAQSVLEELKKELGLK